MKKKSASPKSTISYTASEIQTLREHVAVINQQDAAEQTRKELKRQTALLQQTATNEFIAHQNDVQEKCNHRKGGRGPQSIYKGQGGDPSYALIHHRLPHGGTMVLCQRCLKEWHPADPFTGASATEGWEWAMNQPTDNFPSGSSLFYDPNNAESTRKIYEARLSELQMLYNNVSQRMSEQEYLNKKAKSITSKLETEVSELKTQVLRLTPPAQFFARLKFALKILTSQLRTQEN